MSAGEDKKCTSSFEQPQGTIQITISAGDGVQGQMAGQLIFDQDSSFISDLLEMADRRIPGPIPIGQSEEIIEPPKASPRHLQQAYRQSARGDALYAGQDRRCSGQINDCHCRPGGGCDYYTNSRDPSTYEFYDEIESGPESCVVTPRQPLVRAADGKERMTAGGETRIDANQVPQAAGGNSSNVPSYQENPCKPVLVRIGGKERMAAGGEVRRGGNIHDVTGYSVGPWGCNQLPPKEYSFRNVMPSQCQNQGRLTSGYCYCNPGYPSPCGFGDCSKAPFGYCRTEQPQPAAGSGGGGGQGGFDLGAHNENIHALTQKTQSDLNGLRSNLSCTTGENVNYVWDSNYSGYAAGPWDSYDRYYFNTADRVYFEQTVRPEPPTKKEKTPPCPIHPTTCPLPAPCPDDNEPLCPIDLTGRIVTREAFTRATNENNFATGMTGCSESRSTQENNFRRSVIPQFRDLPDAKSFRENKILQFACGEDNMEGEEMYSDKKATQYFGRSTTYGNCFENKATEDRCLKRRLGCPIPLPEPSYGQRVCDLYPMSGGNAAAGPNEWTNEWDTTFPKEEIFLHHTQAYDCEQNNVGFSEVLNDQKEFKRTSRPTQQPPRDPCDPCEPPDPCEYGPMKKEPACPEPRVCAGDDTEPPCMKQTADKGCVEPEESECDDEEGEEGVCDGAASGGGNKFDPCSGQGNAVIFKNFRTRRVDKDCTGTIEMLQSELDQEHSHTTCWGGSVYAATGAQPKRSNAFDRMCAA